MENLKNFIVEHKICLSNFVAYIGKINGIPAIYTLPHPTLTKETIQNVLNSSISDSNIIEVNLPIQSKLVYPATEEHISKYLKPMRHKIETYEEYLSNNDFLKTSWLDNIILNKASNELVYHEDNNFMIIADYKWDRKSLDDLYLLLIFKDAKFRSLRDFNDVQVLKEAKDAISKAIKNIGILPDSICTYFHYRPSYFRSHIHIINISHSLNFFGLPTRNIFLDEVIKNLELDPEYYKKDISILTYDQ